MFENRAGEPMTGSGINWIVKNAARQAGITKGIYSHTLKHRNYSYRLKTSELQEYFP
ncbi:MAG: hypothetical protein LBS20_10130 [Prevotella sp.]|jgi:site-specific recombinase XerD|nr:hypothetical protein [Prevotella sp.]